MWICPTCKSPDHLEVTVEQWAKLNQPDYDPGQFETDADEASEHNHEWTSNSVMRCMRAECKDRFTCRIAGEFEVEACTLCNAPIDEGDGDNWDSFCPACADKVSACMDAKGLEKEVAEDFLRDNPDWDKPLSVGESFVLAAMSKAWSDGENKLQADREVGETEPRTEV